MAEEVSAEKAKEIVEMLTGGGSIDSINTSLALGILPLVESIGDHDLVERLVEHAQKVAAYNKKINGLQVNRPLNISQLV